MKSKFLIVSFGLFLGISACGKKSKSEKKDDDSSNGQLTDAVKEPEALLDTTITTLASAMDTDVSESMISSLAIPALVASGLDVDVDCTEHGEPKARTNDAAEDKDNSGRLQLGVSRMPLQDFYCKMQKDTGAPDTFLGALSSAKMMFCFMGRGINFNGQPLKKTLVKADLLECIKDRTEAEQEDILGQLGDSVDVVITASAPPAFGDKKTWDGSIELIAKIGDNDSKIRILVRDRGGVVAISNNDGADREEAVITWVVAINKSKGEARYEAKFQRIRSVDGKSSNGWNRHAVALVKGELNSDLTFKSVSEAHGLYSDISVNYSDSNMPTDPNSPVKTGSMWSVSGSKDDGFRSYSYSLHCTFVNNDSTCDDPNVAANWTPTAGSGACDGMMVGTTCSGDGLPLTKDSQTSFIMDLKNDDFQKAEDWFDELVVPAYDSLTISINQ